MISAWVIIVHSLGFPVLDPSSTGKGPLPSVPVTYPGPGAFLARQPAPSRYPYAEGLRRLAAYCLDRQAKGELPLEQQESDQRGQQREQCGGQKYTDADLVVGE